MNLEYRPMNTPYKVNVVYVTGGRGETQFQTGREGDPQDFRAKLDTAAKLMQTFTAESMHRAGYGRNTFDLHLDAQGKVVVHTPRYFLSEDILRKRSGMDLYFTLYGWIDKQFPMSTNKNLVVMAFSQLNPETGEAEGHTALGGGGMGLFSNTGMWTWPDSIADVNRAFTDDTLIDKTRLHDDSANRGKAWAVASTTIGAMLHEMGHTFGLPHTGDPSSIMSRGFDRFNRMFTLVEPPTVRTTERVFFKPDEIARWEPRSAAQLAALRWFQPDTRAFDGTPPTVGIDRRTGEIVIRAKNGIAAVVFMGSNKEIEGDDAYKAFLHEGFRSDRPAELRYPIADLRKKQGERERFRVQAFDADGNAAELDDRWSP
jgi:hypothetical protein